MSCAPNGLTEMEDNVFVSVVDGNPRWGEAPIFVKPVRCSSERSVLVSSTRRLLAVSKHGKPRAMHEAFGKLQTGPARVEATGNAGWNVRSARTVFSFLVELGGSRFARAVLSR